MRLEATIGLCCLLTAAYAEPKWLLVETNGGKGEEQGPHAPQGKNGRILGGTAARSMAEAPWQVLLLTRKVQAVRNVPDGPGILRVCGGVIFSKKLVITAAHCVHDWAFPERHAPPTNVYAYYGNVRRDSMTRAASYLVKKVMIHPEYNTGTYANDIAVLELAEDVQLDKFGMKLACLPDRPWSRYLAMKATASGYGKLSVTYWDNSAPNLMVLSGLKLYDKCPKASAGEHGVIPEGAECAGGELGKDTCQGDSGGPLWVNNMTGCKSGGTVIGVTRVHPCTEGHPRRVHRRVRHAEAGQFLALRLPQHYEGKVPGSQK